MAEAVGPAPSPAVSSAPSPAVAPPPGSPRFALVDSLRAIAVLCVLTYHVTLTSGELNRPVIGDLFPVLSSQGLTLFFAISGFLLYRPFVAARRGAARRPSLRRYGRRRVLRIVPAYWVALTVLAIFPGIVGVFSGQGWRYYLFLQGFSSSTVVSGIPSAWSLSAEVSFYITLPLWAIVMGRLDRFLVRARWPQWELVALAAVALGGIVVQLLASRLIVSSLLVTTLAGESTWFALGMALAVVSVWETTRVQPPAVIRLVAEHGDACWLGALACLLGAVAVLHPGGLFNIIVSLRTAQPVARTLGAILLTGGFCVLLMAPALFGEFSGGVARWILSWRALLSLGVISYGVYLYHLTIAELLGESSDPAHFRASGAGLSLGGTHLRTIVLWTATVVVSVAVATISYRLVELPLLRRKEPGRSRPAAEAPERPSAGMS
jgi:peptidoglycan/LPS O-acetylase OafA/YrhL